jgi:hypothetical protein
VAQLGVTQTRRQSFVAAMADLALEQQGEPFEMRELGGLAGSLQVAAGFDHAFEAEFAQLIEGGMSKHEVVS